MTGLRNPDSEWWFTVLSKVSSGSQTNDTDYAAVVIEHMLAWTLGTGQRLCALINWTQKQHLRNLNLSGVNRSAEMLPVLHVTAKLSVTQVRWFSGSGTNSAKPVNEMTRTLQRNERVVAFTLQIVAFVEQGYVRLYLEFDKQYIGSYEIISI